MALGFLFYVLFHDDWVSVLGILLGFGIGAIFYSIK
jgi:hypothetical protein